MLATNFSDLSAVFNFFENPNHLTFRESRFSHGSYLLDKIHVGENLYFGWFYFTENLQGQFTALPLARHSHLIFVVYIFKYVKAIALSFF